MNLALLLLGQDFIKVPLVALPAKFKHGRRGNRLALVLCQAKAKPTNDLSRPDQGVADAMRQMLATCHGPDYRTNRELAQRTSGCLMKGKPGVPCRSTGVPCRSKSRSQNDLPIVPSAIATHEGQDLAGDVARASRCGHEHKCWG